MYTHGYGFKFDRLYESVYIAPVMAMKIGSSGYGFQLGGCRIVGAFIYLRI